MAKKETNFRKALKDEKDSALLSPVIDLLVAKINEDFDPTVTKDDILAFTDDAKMAVGIKATVAGKKDGEKSMENVGAIVGMVFFSAFATDEDGDTLVSNVDVYEDSDKFLKEILGIPSLSEMLAMMMKNEKQDD
jgi:hypothetical protein